MKYTYLLGIFFVTSMALTSCKSGCMECSGMSAPREICEDDYIEKGDFQAEISAYQAAGGTCEEK